jgi:hypothetical protein
MEATIPARVRTASKIVMITDEILISAVLTVKRKA